MSGNHNDDYDFSKDVDIDVDVDIDYDVDFDKDIDVDTDIDVDIDQCVHIDGNFAQITFDVEAVGEDTYAEIDFAVLTVEGELSSITGVATSASG